MELSVRLQQIANKVKKNSIVADIGTDHAYIPIFLHKQQLIQKSFACDVSKGPLNNAINNIKNYNLENNIITRLSNGLEKITLEDNVDTIIIAGMGGMLMIDILSNGKNIVDNASTLILQPQKSTFQLRKYLYEVGFFIVEDDILIEDGRYYNIIVAKNSSNIEYQDYIDYTEYTEVEYMFGRFEINNKSKILKSYILEEITRMEKILEKNLNNNLDNNLDNNNNSILKLQNNYNLHKEVLNCL